LKGKKLSYKERIKRLEEEPKERRKMFERLCGHVAKGYSFESFSEVTTKSLREYFKAYPEEFSQEEFELAMQKGRDLWEDIGHRQASGSCLGNSRTWYYNMSNRYGWSDKVQVEAEHKGSMAVNIISYASSKPS
jgi:hypothetical protein